MGLWSGNSDRLVSFVSVNIPPYGADAELSLWVHKVSFCMSCRPRRPADVLPTAATQPFCLQTLR